MSTYSNFTNLVQMCSGIRKSADEVIGAWPVVQAIVCDWVATPWSGGSCVAAGTVRAGSVAAGSVSAGCVAAGRSRVLSAGGLYASNP